jgi:hypothetical protein
MIKKTSEYRRIPGKRFFFFMSHSLWQGPDHLLWVEGNMMAEQYKRFYYRDIQATIMCRNRRRLMWSVIWGIMVMLGALGAWVSHSPGFFYTYSGLFSILLVSNILAGPGCDVYLQTAVHLEKITTLARIGKAVTALDHLRALVERAQGVLYAQEMARNYDTVEVSDRSRKPAGASNIEPAVDAPGQAYPLGLPWMMVGLLLAIGMLGFLQRHFKSIWPGAAGLLMLIGLLILAIIILVRGHRWKNIYLQPHWSWLALILAVVRGVTAYIYFFMAIIRQPETANNTAMAMEQTLELQMMDHPWTNVIGAGSDAAAVLLGLLIAAALLMNERRQDGRIRVST